VRVAAESGTPATGTVVEDVNLYGPLCMNIDVLQMKTALPPVRKGAILVIRNVGAYNFTQSMQFIQPRPAVVLINGGEAEYIRMPENTEYIRQLERVPKRLATKPS
jgi:diaminopimelate decarboxylase